MAIQRWQCLSVTVPLEVAEAVANFFLELGSTGVVEGEQDPATLDSPTTTVQGFFLAERSSHDLLAAVTHYLYELSIVFPSLAALSHSSPQLSDISSEAWYGNQWRDHFPPIEVGTKFLILPPWENVSAPTDRLLIVIDPSMAFGTGHHATTQSCLEAIETLCVLNGPPQRALDLGTGSGILAIALSQLGTPEVWATDTDPIALEETQKNLSAHRIVADVHLSDQPVEALPLPFPLIVANLFASTLITLAPVLSQAVSQEGYAILSGIQVAQASAVEAAFPAPTWQPVFRLDREEWVTLVFQRYETRRSLS